MEWIENRYSNSQLCLMVMESIESFAPFEGPSPIYTYTALSTAYSSRKTYMLFEYCVSVISWLLWPCQQSVNWVHAWRNIVLLNPTLHNDYVSMLAGDRSCFFTGLIESLLLKNDTINLTNREQIRNFLIQLENVQYAKQSQSSVLKVRWWSYLLF